MSIARALTKAQKKMLAELKAGEIEITGRRARSMDALVDFGLAKVVKRWTEGGELGISIRACFRVRVTASGKRA